MNKFFRNTLAGFALVAMGCTGGAPASNGGALSAGPDAQHVGVYSYTAANDTVTLFDRYGMELGQVTVTAPSSQGRHFELAAVDGTTDEADVTRPLPNGRFFAPVTPETMLLATMADQALASFWSEHQLAFSLNLAPRLSADGVQPAAVATTTTCSTYSCGQSCSPVGCAKPGNTSLGCTNPAQLPATSTNSTSMQYALNGSCYPDMGTCFSHGPANDCVAYFGGTTADYSGGAGEGSATCGYYLGQGCVRAQCTVGTSTNSWVASCPRQTCGTIGQYDSVPRNGSCNNPGSCSYSQGTVGCTPYH